jgi:LacI family transcriptional regulator
MARSRTSITIADVAETAGVSISTVSRVLNDKDDVAEGTYERVQKVIQEMGYTVNLAAKSMRSHRTNVIGLVMPDLEQPFSLEIMRGVNHAIAELDCDLIVYTSGTHKKKSVDERERHYVTLLNGSITDGVIVVAPSSSSFSTHAPVVAVDYNHADPPQYPSIITTNRHGALAATQHLIELGHKRIGYIGGRPELWSSLRRLQGYEDAHELAGIPVQPELVVYGDYSTERGYECAMQLLNLPQPPTAIFATNDQSAFGVLRAAQERGFRIPEDLSVVGFDNIPESAYTVPPLTTVDQSLSHMGYLATNILLDLVRGASLPAPIQKIPTNLIVRQSTASITNAQNE